MKRTANYAGSGWVFLCSSGREAAEAETAQGRAVEDGEIRISRP